MTASMPAAHLAQINIATLRHPLDDPRMTPFVEMLDPVNAAADGAPGFVWRLVEEGEADATGMRPAGEDVIVHFPCYSDDRKTEWPIRIMKWIDLSKFRGARAAGRRALPSHEGIPFTTPFHGGSL